MNCPLKSIDVYKRQYVRIDTHEDNKPMQGALKKFGFRECGVIHLERGAERIAFDCRKNVYKRQTLDSRSLVYHKLEAAAWM